MKRFLFITVCMLFMPSAEALDDLRLCGPNIHPIDCYVARSMAALMLHEVESGLALAQVNAGQRRYTDASSAISSGARSYREEIDRFYQAAATSLATKGDAANLLKDYQAFWIGTLGNVSQTPNETKGAYERRIAERKSLLEDKGNRLKLEK